MHFRVTGHQLGVRDGGNPSHRDGCSFIKNSVRKGNPRSGLVVGYD